MQTAQIEFLKTRWNWRWVFLTVAVLILASSVVYAWMRPDLYRSETRILVMPEVVFDRELSAAETKDSIENHIQSLQQMLESRSILERLVNEFNLRSDNTNIFMEDGLRSIRSNLQISRTHSGNIFTMAFYDTDPQRARAVTQRLAEILLSRNRESQRSRADEKNVFLDQELSEAERKLAAIDEKIAQIRMTHSGERQDFPVQQAMLREQARLQRHVDEIDHMRFNSQMTANALRDPQVDSYEILDPASLPERPMSPSRLHILWMGIAVALIVALPAAFMQRKAPTGSA